MTMAVFFIYMSFFSPWNQSIFRLNILIREGKHLVILSWVLFFFLSLIVLTHVAKVWESPVCHLFTICCYCPDSIYLRHLRKKSYHLFYRLKWVEVSFLFERLEVISVTGTDGVIFNDSFLRVWVMKLNFGHYIQNQTKQCRLEPNINQTDFTI